MDINNKQKVSEFFASYSHELKSKMNRLDLLIGRDHWLSVGNYKESLLRDLLSNLLPKKYELSTGFILSTDDEGNEIKSKQQDIIIWDSSEYAAIFRDNDFVIVPPEACKAVIEVKSTLTTEKLKKALNSSDNLYEFVRIPSFRNHEIKKYIFAYSSNLTFPTGIYDGLNLFYTDNDPTKLSMEDRTKITKEKWPGNRSWSLFSIDGIFILDNGAIIRTVRAFKSSIRFIFNAYQSDSIETDQVYTFFEHEINRSINSTNGNPGLYYEKQPGLLSLMRHLKICRAKEKPLMILPAFEKDQSYKDIEKQNVYVPK